MHFSVGRSGVTPDSNLIGLAMAVENIENFLKRTPPTSSRARGNRQPPNRKDERMQATPPLTIEVVSDIV